MLATTRRCRAGFGRNRRRLRAQDGVVEAANPKGELFGFDRTREISARSAQHLAETARAWGQNDDITVVTVRNARIVRKAQGLTSIAEWLDTGSAAGSLVITIMGAVNQWEREAIGERTRAGGDPPAALQGN